MDIKTVVSIIVPVYNVEKYLPRCLDSIIGQSYRKLDIILVDDGAKDDSGKICDKYAGIDRRIKVIHKVNGGLSDARNVGLENSRGEYVLFVDSDDWIDPDMVKILLKVIKEKNADVVECGFREIYGNYINVDYACSGNIEQFSKIRAISECMQWKKIKPVAWNKIYARKTIGEVRYPVGKLHEDEFTTHRILYNAKKIIYVDLALYNYDCTKEDSITARFKVQNLDACEAMRQKIHFVLEHEELRPLSDVVCNVYCFTLFDNLARSVDAEEQDSAMVKETVKKALDEKKELLRHKIESLYKQCLNELEKYGVERCVMVWKKRRGVDLK